MAETFELTPEQWTRLMERLGNNYGAYDDCVAHTVGGRMFSQTYIVSGQSESELISRGTVAVSTNGQGALASVEVRYSPGATSPTSFSLTTSDPEIIRQARALEAREAVSQALRRMMEAMRQIMSPPENRQRRMMEIFEQMRERMERTPGTVDEAMRRMMDSSREQPAEGRTAGRDRILGDVGRALEGTAFSVPSGVSLTILEQRSRNVDPGIMRDLGPGTGVPMPQLGGPMTGFMRYMEPDGTSSVYSGERMLYTDIPMFERTPFGSERAAGTLRIYGELNRPDRYEIITDNPALRSAAERANIPVRPATMQEGQERERPRPRT